MILRAVFNPEASAADVRAALDSYGVELKKSGRPILRVALFMVAPGSGLLFEPKTQTVRSARPLFDEDFSTEVDRLLQLRLIRYEPQGEMEEDPPATRWPFFVEQPLEIVFCFGSQWWSYKFSPGKKYEEIEDPAA
jgi:hypothetical protein